MNFEHTEDRRMLADALDRYLADKYDIVQRNRVAHGSEGFSQEHWKQLLNIGALAACFPENVGGFGGTGFDVAVVFESLGKGLVVEPFLDALIIGRALAFAGNASQKAHIAALTGGDSVAALAHDEPGGHYEATRVATRAERAGDGWVLNGAKAVVQHGDKADLLLVSARIAGTTQDAQGIALFLVPANTSGLTWRAYPKIDGGRAAELSMNGARVDAGALLGVAGEGAAVLEHAIGWGLLALAAESLGAMEVARRDTLEYLRTRKQFGVPIGSFQALQHRMAELLIAIEQARSAVINAAAAINNTDRRVREKALSAAKYTAGNTGTLVAQECIQMHGGIAMTWELPFAHYAKRLVMIDHQLGDEDHHLARYIALGAGDQQQA